MKKIYWIVLLAVALLVTGAVLMGFAMMGGEINIDGKTYMKFEEEKKDVLEEFHAVQIDVTFFDVELCPTLGTAVHVKSAKSEYIYCETSVVDGVLTVKQVDTRKWYQKLATLTLGEPKLTVSLPYDIYESLTVKVRSGDVTVRGDEALRDEAGSPVPMAIFRTVSMDVTSGDVQILSSTLNGARIETTSGDITVKNVKGGAMELRTTSGDIVMEDCTPDSLAVNVTSGDVEGYRVKVVGAMHVEGTSSEVELRYCDAASAYIKSTSGDVTVCFTSHKAYDIETTSGEQECLVPWDPMGGKCEIRTTSGDVYFNVIVPEE